MIELVSTERCISCDKCVAVCPTNVFDRDAAGVPVISRQDDCQTCFQCEANCPVDALFVSPFVTPQSDIYSLGLVLYFAASGQKLDMGGSQFDLVEKRRRVPNLDVVDARLRPLLSRMLEPDPARRPASMAEIAAWTFAAAQPAVTPSRVAIDTGTASSPAAADPRRYSMWIIVAGVAAIIAACAAFYLFYLTTDTEAPRPAPPKLSPGATVPQPSPAPPDKTPYATSPAVPPPPPVSSTNVPASRADQIRNYVEAYEGGDCLFLLPVAISANAAVLEGFAASPARFEAFSASFKRDLGFAPAIGARLVTDAQCAAVRFLNQLRGERTRTPRISLASTEVQNGETLNGSIENVANRSVELLLISDTGNVQNLSNLLKPGIDVLSFSIGMQRSDGPGRPQLLMAVASTASVDALKMPRPLAADQYFPKVFVDTQAGAITMTAAARYFRLGK